MSLERETGIYHPQIHKWTKQYLEGGEEALVNKRKPGNPLAKYHRKKELTPIVQLEYKVALLERELLKKDAEVVRLKKSIELERGDAKRILKKAKSTGAQILLHSDQGVQYSSAGYCNLLKAYNAIQSMSRAGTPRDNAVIESFLVGSKMFSVQILSIGDVITSMM